MGAQRLALAGCVGDRDKADWALPASTAALAKPHDRLRWIFGFMPETAAMRWRNATELSGGQQKMAALAAALMAGSRLLILDGPFEGLAPALAPTHRSPVTRRPRRDVMEATAVYDNSVRPIVEAGLHELVETDHRLTGGIWLMPTPGHAPDHVSVFLSSKGSEAVITGDIMHHDAAIVRLTGALFWSRTTNGRCSAAT